MASQEQQRPDAVSAFSNSGSSGSAPVRLWEFQFQADIDSPSGIFIEADTALNRLYWWILFGCFCKTFTGGFAENPVCGGQHIIIKEEFGALTVMKSREVCIALEESLPNSLVGALHQRMPGEITLKTGLTALPKSSTR